MRERVLQPTVPAVDPLSGARPGRQLLNVRRPDLHVRNVIVAVGTVVLAGCLNAPKPVLSPTIGSLEMLRGATTIVVYGDQEDVEVIQAEISRVHPDARFVRGEEAQVMLMFTFAGTPACIDCGPGYGDAPFQPVFAFGTVERRDDRDHCFPNLLLAEWTHESYRRRRLAKLFARQVAALF